GQTSPGLLRTYCAALILPTNVLASRPIPSALISAACTIPSGSIMNVPRCAKPFSSSSTSKPLEIACDGSPIITYSNLLLHLDGHAKLCVRNVYLLIQNKLLHLSLLILHNDLVHLLIQLDKRM